MVEDGKGKAGMRGRGEKFYLLSKEVKTSVLNVGSGILFVATIFLEVLWAANCPTVPYCVLRIRFKYF